MIYSQGNEQEIIEKYFGNRVGVLWDFGCNDGISLSNSYHLLKNRGWSGVLLDASDECIKRAKENHGDNPNITYINSGLSMKEGSFELFHSGTHLNKGDVSLLSSFNESEIEKWKPTTSFTKKIVKCVTFNTFYQQLERFKEPDFITIDIEGFDYQILTSIDLNLTKTKCVCVEWNSIEPQKYIDYCSRFGMKLIWKSGENLIFAR